MNIPIKKTLDKIPGGMMLVPLLLGCLIKSFFPEVLSIGGFTTALTQANPMIAMFFLIVGSNLTFKEAPKAIKTGVVITLTKMLVGIAIGLLVARIFHDNLLGMSSLAIIAAMTNSNGGLYLALTGQYGNKTEVGAYAVTALNDGPFFTMIALGTAGLATIPFMSLVSCIIPIVIGMLLGNLDSEMREFLTKGYEKIIPFFAFALGTGLTIEMVIKGGISGILLGVMTTFIGGIFTIIADKITGGTGVAGAAISSTAGNAVATPELIAAADPALAAAATLATPQIAASTVTTALLTPVLTNWYVNFIKKNS